MIRMRKYYKPCSIAEACKWAVAAAAAIDVIIVQVVFPRWH